MKRVVITPADLAGPALADLKKWLAISGERDDAALIDLLHAALDNCEAFTGTMPLEQSCSEMLAPNTAWQTLAARPVQSVSQIDSVTAGGAVIAVPIQDFAIELEADGTARVRLASPAAGATVTVRFDAGLAPGWAALPGGMRHGILRYAAEAFRERDSGSPPEGISSAIAALWRPWCRPRLA
ncbi:head-tail connector protein [Altererythrobacter aquiaggeris]|uniref:head-tail connector protein n=1 Tax=Aestuarierythrobacter aquiaggeris TaxID=1898396 RepID=UPI003016F87B